MSLYSPYIKEEWKDNIRSYKYRGSDISIFFVYVTNPFCNWLIKYFPRNLAPNLVILIIYLDNFFRFFTELYNDVLSKLLWRMGLSIYHS